MRTGSPSSVATPGNSLRFHSGCHWNWWFTIFSGKPWEFWFTIFSGNPWEFSSLSPPLVSSTSLRPRLFRGTGCVTSGGALAPERPPWAPRSQLRSIQNFVGKTFFLNFSGLSRKIWATLLWLNPSQICTRIRCFGGILRVPNGPLRHFPTNHDAFFSNKKSTGLTSIWLIFFWPAQNLSKKRVINRTQLRIDETKNSI